MKDKLNNRARIKIQNERLNHHTTLTAVVMALNGDNPLLRDSEDRRALIRYVEAWNSSGRNPWKMVLSPTDAKRFSLSNLERVWAWTLAPIGRPQNPEAQRIFRELERDIERRGMRVRPDEAGGAYWALFPIGENRDQAAMFVGMLLTNPLRGKLSDGPCQRKRCGKWFIKRRPLQKQCNRRCLAIVRSMEAVKKERQDAHTENLKNARRALRSWKRKSGLDWKTYVAGATGLTKKFITRAVTNKELTAPELRSQQMRGRKQQ